MYDKFAPMRRNVFRNPSVLMETRTELCTSLLHTRLLYNCCTWSPLKIHEARKLQQAYLVHHRVMHDMVNLSVGARYTDVQVYVAAKALTLGVEVRIQRLRYLARLMSMGPPVLIHLILLQVGSPNSWITLIMDDLHQAWQSCDNLQSTMPDPLLDISEWLRCIALFPKVWTTSFKQLFKSNACSAASGGDTLGILCTSKARQAAPKGFFVCEICNMFFDVFRGPRVLLFAQSKTPRVSKSHAA